MFGKIVVPFLLSFFFLHSTPAISQFINELEISTGIAMYRGDVITKPNKVSTISSLKAGLRGSISLEWSLFTNAGYYNYTVDNNFDTQILEGNLLAEFYPFNKHPVGKFLPISLHVGLGLSFLNVYDLTPRTTTTGTSLPINQANVLVPIHIGLGLRYFFNLYTGIRFYSDWRYTKNDEIDGVIAASDNDFYADLNVGIIFRLGR